MNTHRRQLTLFLDESDSTIENIRKKFNPEQFELIPAHVTLCREDEIEAIDQVIERLHKVSFRKPIRIRFNTPKRFAGGKGLSLPALDYNSEFRDLRKQVLGQFILTREQVPHITLLHPRNSTCTDDIFNQIKNMELPAALSFSKVSLIEQKNGGKWEILQEFDISE